MNSRFRQEYAKSYMYAFRQLGKAFCNLIREGKKGLKVLEDFERIFVMAKEEKKIPVVVIKYSDGTEYRCRKDKAGWEDLVNSLAEEKNARGIELSTKKHVMMRVCEYMVGRLI